MTNARPHQLDTSPSSQPHRRRARTLGALALLGALLAGCGAQAGAWRLIGPDSGAHVFTIVADPHVAGLVYAGADDGGVYRALADQQGNAASGDGIPHDTVVASLLPDPQRAGVILAGTSGGLYRSNDYGDHWSAWSVGLPRTRTVVALAETPDDATLLAGVDHGGLYRSVDVGANWAASTSGLPAQATPVALAWDAPAHLWLLGLVATSATPLFASADAGQTWTPRATGLPAGAEVNALALLGGSGATQATLFAATTRGLYTSADAGQSWSLVGGGLPQGSALALATLSQQPSWLYVSIGSGVYRSTNSGAQWQVVAPGLTAEAQGLAVTEGKQSGPVVFVAAGQVARYPTGVPASGGIPGEVVLALIAVALIVGGYVIMRRMRRFGYTMGAMRNERNTGSAAAAAERWSAEQQRRRSASASAGDASEARHAESAPPGKGRIITPTETTTTGAPADTAKAAQNGHGKPKKRK